MLVTVKVENEQEEDQDNYDEQDAAYNTEEHDAASTDIIFAQTIWNWSRRLASWSLKQGWKEGVAVCFMWDTLIRMESNLGKASCPWQGACQDLSQYHPKQVPYFPELCEWSQLLQTHRGNA